MDEWPKWVQGLVEGKSVREARLIVRGASKHERGQSKSRDYYRGRRRARKRQRRARQAQRGRR